MICFLFLVLRMYNEGILGDAYLILYLRIYIMQKFKERRYHYILCKNPRRCYLFLCLSIDYARILGEVYLFLGLSIYYAIILGEAYLSLGLSIYLMIRFLGEAYLFLGLGII